MVFWKKDKRRDPIVSDGWVIYTYTYGPPGEEMRAIVRVDAELAEADAPGYPHGRRMILFARPQQITPTGLPTKDENQALTALEDRFIAALDKARVSCRLAGVMTYGGMKDLVFQVDNAEAWDKVADAWLRDERTRQAETRGYDGWSFFADRVRPDAAQWQQIMDQRVISAMIAHGANPAAVHRTEHTIVGDDAVLARLASAIRGYGVAVEVKQGQLLIEHDTTLELDAIWSFTRFLGGISAEHGAEYDGWGAMIVK